MSKGSNSELFDMATSMEKKAWLEAQIAFDKRQSLHDLRQPLEKALLSNEYQNKATQLGKAVCNTCFVIYDNLAVSDLVTLNDNEPYNLLDQADSQAITTSPFRQLIAESQASSIKPASGQNVMMLAYNQPHLAVESLSQPTILDVELIYKMHELYPGITSVKIGRNQNKYTNMQLLRIDPESRYHIHRFDHLGQAACRAAMQYSLLAGGINMSEVNLNGNSSLYHRQVNKAVSALTTKIKA